MAKAQGDVTAVNEKQTQTPAAPPDSDLWMPGDDEKAPPPAPKEQPKAQEPQAQEPQAVPQEPETPEPQAAEEPSGGEPKDDEYVPDAVLVGQAESYGASKAFAEQLDRQGLLGRFLAEQDRMSVVKVREEGQPPAGSQAPTAQPQPQQRETPAATPELAPFKVTLTEEDYEPAVVKTLNDMSAHYAQVAERQQMRIGQLEQTLQAQAESEEFEWFDSQVKQLGSDAEQFFGKGDVLSLDRNSDEYQRRNALMWFYRDLQAAEAMRKARPTPRNVLLQRAYRALFSDKADNDMKKGLSQQLRNNQGRYVARPNAQKAPTGQKSARDQLIALRTKMRSMGWTPDAEVPDGLEGLPE